MSSTTFVLADVCTNASSMFASLMCILFLLITSFGALMKHDFNSEVSTLKRTSPVINLSLVWHPAALLVLLAGARRAPCPVHHSYCFSCFVTGLTALLLLKELMIDVGVTSVACSAVTH